MIMRSGYLCKICNVIFKSEEEVLKHFIEKHSRIVMIKLEEFICSHQFLDEETN